MILFMKEGNGSWHAVRRCTTTQVASAQRRGHMPTAQRSLAPPLEPPRNTVTENANHRPLLLQMGLGSRGGILAARRLRGEPEPFEDEQDDDEYEDGEYVDLDDEELLGDLDELDEMEIDGEWDEGEWEEDRQAEEELGEGEERPGAGAGAGEGRKGGVAPPLPPSPRPGRDWRS